MTGGSGAVPCRRRLTPFDDMRTAAKWMLAAAGAVGAALISGGPLVAVGQVHGLWHAFLAWLGLVVALGGVGVAIWYTSQVLVPRLTTPNTMRKADELDGLRTVIANEPRSSWASRRNRWTACSSARTCCGTRLWR